MTGVVGSEFKRDGLGQRAAFAFTAYAFAVTMVGTTLPTPLYGLYRVKFGFSELTVTIIFATYAGGVIAALLLFGPLSDEIGRRRMLLAGLAMSLLSGAAFLLADGLGALLVGRALSGLSAGIFTGTATATLLDLAADGGRGRATLFGTLANMIGLGSGPLLAGLLSQWFGSPLRLSFWAQLALLVPAAIGVWAMPEPGSPSRRPKLRTQPLTVAPPLRAAFIRASLAGFAGFAVLGLFTAVSPAFLSQQLGVASRAIIGLVVFAVFLASAAGQLALERIPERVALPLGCAKLVAGMAILALGLAVSSLALLVIGGVAAGFGQGLSFRAALAGLSAGSPPAQRAEVASSFFVVAYVAISVPVIGVGVLAQATNLRTAGLIFAGVVAALAATALLLLLRQGPD